MDIKIKELAVITVLAMVSTCAGLGQLGGLELLPLFDEIYSLRQFGPKAKIDSNSITVSGLSSGAFMSTQLHVALSSLIKGSGIFAGGPYGRACDAPSGTFGGGINWLTYSILPNVNDKSTSQLVEQARKFEAEGHIDPLQNLNNSKAYIFHGKIDPIVQSSEGVRAEELYDALGVQTKMRLHKRCSHGLPTDNFGGPCGFINGLHDGVNNCDYEGVFDMFSHLYDDFKLPASSSSDQPLGSKFYTFDQSPFAPSQYATSRAYMAPTGYIYIPAGCQNAEVTCRLHLAMHGCFQSVYTEYEILDNLFALKTGYTQVADANNVVMIFPQPAPHYLDVGNSNLGCWDFFGGTTSEFPFKTAPQIQTLYNIIAAMTGHAPIP